MHTPGMARERNARRLLLAQEAARIMTREGISDFGAARRMAACRLGIAARRFWPSDEEILEAAHEWQRIYRFNHDTEHLNRLRRLACDAMAFLEVFSPCLTGGVATGVAGEYAAITLDVFADTVEDVLKKLLDARIPYTLHGDGSRYGRRREALPVSEIRFVVDGVATELRVWPAVCRRQMPKRKEAPRLTLSDVRQLLKEDCRD